MKRIVKDSEIQEFINLFELGKTLQEIESLTNYSRETIKKYLNFVGINYTELVNTKKEEKKQRILELYSQGKSQSFIEKELKVTRKTIRELLKLNPEIKQRTKSEQQCINKNTQINNNCFDELTEESLYWIGMLYTDGHINDKEYSIDLTLHTDDIEHLNKLKTFTESNREIYIRPNSQECRFRFNSEKIHKRLKELGFTHNKSNTIIPHELLKNSKHFWRGCVDGDGGVYNHIKKGGKSPTNEIFLCGTFDTIQGFIEFCENNCELHNRKNPSQCKGKNLYQVHYYGKEAVQILNLLYKDSLVYLDRKYNKYLEIIS